MSASSHDVRLRRLERRSQLSLAVAISALVAMLSRGGAEDEVIGADRFELVDSAGRVRAELAVDEDGSAGLFLRDADGRIRASLTHDDQQTALYLRDAHDTIRVGAAQFAHGGGGFALHGAESKGAAVLYMKDGAGTLTVYDVAGKERAKLP